MEAIYEITLDLHSTVSQASLAVKQGDTNRKIYIPLREGGKPYHIERGTFAVFSTITPTGKVIEDGCTIEGNKIVYEFDEALTASSGIMDVEIRIYDVNKKTIITPAFTLIVDPRAAVGEDIKEATDSFTSLDAMYNKLNGIANEVQTKLDNGEFDGVGIESIEQTVTSNEDNGVNEVTVTLADGTQSDFKIRNGSKGTHGDDISNVEYTPSSEDGGTNYLTIERTTYPQIGGKPSVSSEDYPIKNGSRGYKGDDISNVKYVASDEDGGTNYLEIERTTYDKTDGSPSTKKEQYPIRNGNTGAPAGFGEISAEAEVIDIDSAPTVEVEASGKDTEKNFNFKFGIPSDKYRVSEIQKQLNRTTAKTNALDKRVTNLEQGIIPSPYVTDDTVAYTKNVPENTLPYAEVSKIGGMTRKSENLIPSPYKDSTKTISGITFTVTEDNTIIGNGTATEQILFWLVQSQDIGIKKGETYALSGCPSSGSGSTYLMEVSCSGKYPQDNGKGISFVAEDNIISVYIVIRSGVTLNNIVFKPMLNEGTEALPYEPHFEGLRSALVTEVESVGENLLTYPFAETTKEVYGIIYKDNGDGTITANGLATGQANFFFANNETFSLPAGTYTFSVDCILPNGVNVWLYKTSESKVIAYLDSRLQNVTFTLEEEESFNIYIYSPAGSSYSNVVFSPMLNIGTTAKPRKPFVRNTLPIPTEVQAIDGYGEGVDETSFNYIDWEKKQFVKYVERIVLDGSKDESWNTTPTYNTVDFNAFYTRQIPKGHKAQWCEALGDIIPNRTIDELYNLNAVGFWMGDVNDRQIIIRVPNSVTTATELRTWLAEDPLTIVYPLATPEVTDISDILPEDNFIGVEGNGIITLKNEYAYDVPSEITYQIKGVAV